MYESEHTRFMREFLEKNPQLPAKQQEARARWWDKVLDRDLLQRFREARVKSRPYAYQSYIYHDEP